MNKLGWTIATGIAILGLVIAWFAWQYPKPLGGTSPQPSDSSAAPTVKPAAYIGHIVEWVNGGGQPNSSWLVGSNGERYWIPNTRIFFCLVNEGHTDQGPQSSTVLNDLPDSGQWASCP